MDTITVPLHENHLKLVISVIRRRASYLPNIGHARNYGQVRAVQKLPAQKEESANIEQIVVLST